jgi:hypothetical protein
MVQIGVSDLKIPEIFYIHLPGLFQLKSIHQRRNLPPERPSCLTMEQIPSSAPSFDVG